MLRRKSMKENPPQTKKKIKKSLAQPSKKDMTGKQKKRVSALSELMSEEVSEEVVEQKQTEESAVEEEGKGMKDERKDTGGLLGTIKGFYEKADSMAATQALLLNKELEDRGIVEKITDETGLRVIGKEAAAKLKGGQKDGEKMNG